ncbi:MAG: hypothetical protein Q9168_003911 [Polycauliona sp. 1 TL-2023]
MFDWVIAEVRYKAEVFKQFNYIEALDGVWKSDTAIGDKLRRALEQAVRPLEDIPEIVAKAIPLWDKVLSRVITPPLEARTCDWSNSFQGFSAEEEIFETPDRDSGEVDDEYEARLETGDYEDMRDVIQPEPGIFKTPAERMRDYKDFYDFHNTRVPPTEPCVSLRKDYGRLQIIVKLANIHLTPTNSRYTGGSWHVEGQANESICASALYYYASHNVTDSFLSFRQQTHDGGFRLSYPQYDFKAVEHIYGFKNGEPTIQNLGKVHTRQSRLLCFPNVMQHRVSPFQLEDPSKPGYRKLLALFLVDPNIKIISTENIPPQQHAWLNENVETAGVFEKLPPELAGMVLDGAGFPITFEATKKQRLDLMAERKDFATDSEEMLRKKTFDVTL